MADPAGSIRVLELLVSTSVGGGPKHVFDLVTRLPRSEFVPLVGAPPDGPFFERFTKAGIETHALALETPGGEPRPGPLRELRGRRGGCAPAFPGLGSLRLSFAARRPSPGGAPEDPGALAEASAALLTNAPRRKRLGRAGRARVVESFTVEPMVGQIEDIYRLSLTNALQ